MPGAVSCASTSALRPAWARPTPCWWRRRKLKAEGRDVVVGVVETHGRSETAALLGDLQILPPKPMPYRGKDLSEFDLDAALLRRPSLILVDELAHSNVQGRAIPSAGRTSRNCWRRASMYLRP